MRDDIRAFLALRLPDDVTAALGHLTDQMTQARVGGFKPVRPENMHLTLKFFGNINVRQVESIVDTVTHTVKSIRPFTLRLGNVGAYPNNRGPRVLWVGLDGDVAPLQDFHRRIEAALGQIDIKPDTREFRPHLTIARIRDHASHADRRKAAEALFSAEFRSGLLIPADRISLIRSVLQPQGPQYTSLAEIPIGETD
ncbi:MAG: RNA 2',3'-cyclic phosphodiesterase [Dehalococcoidia bacterium]|nr:RNA 2',3'-cyclic phosphodiesterase [Dehalococcoidia bacterium]